MEDNRFNINESNVLVKTYYVPMYGINKEGKKFLTKNLIAILLLVIATIIVLHFTGVLQAPPDSPGL